MGFKFVPPLTLLLLFSHPMLRAQSLDPPDESLYMNPLDPSIGFAMRGDALSRSQRCYLITEDERGRRGRLWWNELIDLTQSTMFRFVIYAGRKDSGGADGFAFVMHDDSRGLEARGQSGRGLSFGSVDRALGGGSSRLAPSLAIEIDTYRNGFGSGNCDVINDGYSWPSTQNDPSYDHVALVRHGAICYPLEVETSGGMARVPRVLPGVDNVEDPNACYDYTVYWTYLSPTLQQIDLFVEDNLRIRYSGNLIDEFFDGATDVLIGFTGSTGGSYNEQAICIALDGYEIMVADDTFLASAGQVNTLDILTNDMDLNAPEIASALSVSDVSSPPSGAVVNVFALPNGIDAIAYMPPLGFTGSEDFTYTVCDDPTGDRCYSECVDATVTVQVGCPASTLIPTKIRDDLRCGDVLPPRGAARAQIAQPGDVSLVYKENFSNASSGSLSGTHVQEDGVTTSWASEQHSFFGVSSQAVVGVMGGNLVMRTTSSNPSAQVAFDFTSPADVTATNMTFRVGTNAAGSAEGIIRAYLSEDGGNYADLLFGGSNRIDLNQNFSAGQVISFSLDLSLTSGTPYTLLLRVSTRSSSQVYLWFDDVFLTFDTSGSTATDVTGDYIVSWYSGDTVSGTPVFVGSDYLSMAAGTYTAEGVYSLSSSCKTSPVSVTILRERPDSGLAYGTAIADEVSPLTNCSTPDGELSSYVVLDAGSVRATSGYAYSWYLTRDLGTPVRTSAVASGLSASDYTVVVSESSTGCKQQVNQTVSSSVIQPSLSVDNVIPGISCDGTSSGTGSIEVSSIDSGVSFHWYVGSEVLPTSAFIGSVYGNLAPGPYTVVSRFSGTGCDSPPETVNLSDASFGLVISDTLIPNASCESPYDGSISVSLELNGNAESLSDYSFSYYTGTSSDVSALISSDVPGGGAPYVSGVGGSVLNRLDGGQYRLDVEDAAGCVHSEVFTILESLDNPVIDVSLVTLSPDYSCDVTDSRGAIDATAPGTVLTDGVFSPDGYQYYLYKYNNTRPLHAENSVGSFVSLSSERYELEVVDKATRCKSSSAYFEVPSEVSVSLALSDIESNRGCVDSTSTGSFVSTLSASQPSDYDYLLYRGRYLDASAVVERRSTISDPVQSFTSLFDGVYTLRVSDDYGCDTEVEVVIARLDDLIPSIVSPSDLVHRSSCASNNGSISVSVRDASGDAVPDPVAAGYTFKWYDGFPLTDATLLNSASGPILSDVPEGLYWLSVSDTYGCSSRVSDFVLEQHAELPLPGIYESSPLTACEESFADGALEVRLSEALSTSLTVTYEWYEDAIGPAGSGVGTSTTLSDVLWEGVYGVRASTSAGCVGTALYDLRSKRVSPALSLSSTTDNGACQNPYNGAIVVGVQFDGNYVPSVAGYEFFLDGGASTVSSNGSGLFTYGGLSGGTYDLSVSHKGCLSNVLQALLSDVPTLPAVSHAVTPSTSCDVVNHPNGAIALRPTSSAAYAFSWSAGTTYEASGVLGTAPTLSALPPATYTARVQGEETGCFADFSFTVRHEPSVLPVFEGFTAEPVENCDPHDGSLTYGLSGVTDYSLYDWHWYEGNAASPDKLLQDPAGGSAGDAVRFATASVSDNVARGLWAGDYTVLFVERATGCRSVLQSSALPFSPASEVVLSPALEYAAGDCEGNEGRMSAFADTAAGGSAHRFDLSVYRGDLSPAELSNTSPEKSRMGLAADEAVRFDLSAYVYTLQVVDTTTACRLSARFLMPYENAPSVVEIVDLRDTENCLPYFNEAGEAGRGGASGSLEVELEVDDTNPDNHSNFMLFLYQGERAGPLPTMVGPSSWSVSAPLSVQSQAGMDVPPDNRGYKVGRYLFVGLSPGEYTVIAARVGDAACYSDVQTGSIEDLHDDLQIGTNDLAIVPNTSCDDAPNGSVLVERIARATPPRANDVDTTPAFLSDSYAYQWAQTPSYEPLLPFSGPEASGLAAGPYYIRIQKIDDQRGDDEGCEAEVLVNVLDMSEPLSLVEVLEEDIRSCQPPEDVASVTVVSVSIGTRQDVSFSSLSSDYEVRVRNVFSDARLEPIVSSAPTLSGFAVGGYALRFWDASRDCASPPVSVTIEDQRLFPTLDARASVVTPHSACEEPPNGGVVAAHQADLSFVPGAVTYRWYVGDELAGTPLATTNPLSGVATGRYRLVAVHVATDCEAAATFVVPDARSHPVLRLDPRTVVSSKLCTSGNGAVSVAIADVSPTSGSYNIELHEGQGGVFFRAGLPLDASHTPARFSALSPGPYTLRAVSAAGCPSRLAAPFEILDDAAPPHIRELRATPDVGCQRGLGAGVLEVYINPTQDADNDGTPDTYEVTVNGETATGVTDYHRAEGLQGTSVPYRVVNEASGCVQNGTLDFQFFEKPVFRIDRLERLPVTHCHPPNNGQARVLKLQFHQTTTEQPEDETRSVFSGYRFEWRDADETVLVNDAATNGEPHEYLSFRAERYTVRVTHEATGCSVEDSFELGTDTTFPSVRIVKEQVDESCPGGTPNGILSGTADGVGDGDPRYSFTWFGPEGSVVSRTARYEGAAAGTYTLDVEQTETKCEARILLELASAPWEVYFSEFRLVPVTVCDPGNGDLEVLALSQGDLSEYQFDLYEENPDTGAAPLRTRPPSAGAVVFDGVAIGPHYLSATHRTLGCQARYDGLLLPDESVPPVVVLERTVLQSLCDPALGNGEFLVSPGSLDLVPLYSYAWYDENDVQVSEKRLASNLRAGTYTVRVRETATGCETERRYTMREAYVNPLALTAYSSGNSRCEAPYNGVLIADVLYSLPGQNLTDYEFLWRKGKEVPTLKGDNYDHLGLSVTELNAGTYTLMAYNRQDPSCTSVPLRVNVEDLRVFPELSLQLLHALSNCTPEATPNGELAVRLEEGSLLDHTFSWRQKEVGGEEFSSSPVIYGLDEGQYYVHVTKVASGCASIKAYLIKPRHDSPPPPHLFLEKHHTDCVKPNGHVRAVHAGGFDPYLSFKWYKGNEGPTSAEPFYIGQQADKLEAGTYSVYAFSQLSACHSAVPSFVEVYNSIIEPEYRIETKDSYCTEYTGSAIPRPKDPVQIEEVVWEIEGQTIRLPEMFPIPPGAHRVKITDATGCEVEKMFDIGVDVLVYNGLSANADGMNDALTIECIEQFPNNKVSIYNSEGVLVYEQAGYQNGQFKGNNATKGNPTLYGTYFYLIDLGNGEETLSGYLELLK